MILCNLYRYRFIYIYIFSKQLEKEKSLKFIKERSKSKVDSHNTHNTNNLNQSNQYSNKSYIKILKEDTSNSNILDTRNSEKPQTSLHKYNSNYQCISMNKLLSKGATDDIDDDDNYEKNIFTFSKPNSETGTYKNSFAEKYGKINYFIK
jgi:hypothetical protein